MILEWRYMKMTILTMMILTAMVMMMMMVVMMMFMDPPIVKKGDESSRGVEELREQDGATRRPGNLVEDEI